MPDGGELLVAAGPSGDGRYALVIGDTGGGIPAGARPRGFEPDLPTQTPPRGAGQGVGEPYFTTKSSGLGLGLVLTRKIVEAHGGEILVDSEPLRGTHVRVFLPGGGP